MSGHAFARVCGFGRTFVPRTPCRWEQVEGEAPTLRLACECAGGCRSALVRCGPGGLEVALEKGTADLAELADVEEGPGQGPWRVETVPFTVRWPAGFAFYATGEAEMPPYYLLGPDGAMIFPQGPYPLARHPAAADLVAAGQRLRRQGKTGESCWVELEYVHAGAEWRQRHYVVWLGADFFVLLTGQWPVDQAGVGEAAADEMAASLTPGPPEGAPGA